MEGWAARDLKAAMRLENWAQVIQLAPIEPGAKLRTCPMLWEDKLQSQSVKPSENAP